jgi:hypothetical protein
MTCNNTEWREIGDSLTENKLITCSESNGADIHWLVGIMFKYYFALDESNQFLFWPAWFISNESGQISCCGSTLISSSSFVFIQILVHLVTPHTEDPWTIVDEILIPSLTEIYIF